MQFNSQQATKYRREFMMARKVARCPKDGGQVLETTMPEVACEQYGTIYTLAFHLGFASMKTKLIEKQGSQPQVVRESKEVTTREIVKVPCKYCGNLNELATAKFCSSCGAPIK
jgi:hypothetical protein